MAEVPQPLFPEVLAEFTYLKPEQDAQLRGKLDTITKRVDFAAYGASNSLTRSYLGKQVRLMTSTDGILLLPPPTLADVGKALVLNHYSGAGPSAVLRLQALIAQDASPTSFALLPRDYTAWLLVVEVDRPRPDNDTVATYIVLSNSAGPLNPSSRFRIDYASPVVRAGEHAYDDFTAADFGKLVVLSLPAQATPQVWEVNLLGGLAYANQLVHVVVASSDNSSYRLTLNGSEVTTITRASGALLQLEEKGTAYRVLSGPDGAGGGGASSFDQLTGNPRDNLRLAAALDALASLGEGRRDLVSTAGNRYNDLVLETRATLTGLKLGPNASAVQAQVLQGGNKAVSAPRTGTPADVLTAIQADINALSSFDFYFVRFQTTPAVSTDVAHVLLSVTA